jgi:3-hydroxyisobutyrate dehydrogenase-like beta-hydroxyacid dehydrogenase
MPVLSALGSKVIHCGEVGQASVVKLIGNTLISFMLEGFCEGIVVGQRAGVRIEKVLEVVMAAGFASPYFTFKGDAIARRDWDTHFSIDLLVKDQKLMLDEASARRAPMPGLEAIREVFEDARAAGWGGEDIAAVFKVLEAAAGASSA